MNPAQKLKIIRQISHMSQEELARELGVSFVTVNRWINEQAIPREKAQDDIDSLYREYTGQKTIPESVLMAKKTLILSKVESQKNIIKLILGRKDLYDSFLLSLTYHSNKIEGSTLSENETARILFQNRSIANKSLIEHLEVKNHQAAFYYLLQHLKKSKKIDESLILRLHGILMNGIQEDAGFYRRHGVRILGANVPTANWLKISHLISVLVGEINKNPKDVLGHVSEIHSRFEKIHPFSDGNGRIGRLIMAAMLMVRQIPPAIIREEKRQLYYVYLSKAQLQEDFTALQDFIADAVLESFEKLED